MGNVGRSSQADQSITKILALEENENDENNNQEGRCYGTKQGDNEAAQSLQGTAAWLVDFNWNERLVLSGAQVCLQGLDGLLLRAINLLAQLLENLLRSLKRSGTSAAAKAFNFRADRRLVPWQIFGQALYLASHDPAKRKD